MAVWRRLPPDGLALTLRVEREHQEVNERWTRLVDGALTGSQRGAAIDRLVDVLREDVRDEEDQLLPRLRESIDASGLRRLGLAWEAVRRTAPTRPQPLVSRRPPGNALAALPLTCWNDPATAWMRRPDVTPQDRGLIVLDLGIQHHRLSSQPAF